MTRQTISDDLLGSAEAEIARLFDAFDQDAAMRHGWCINLYGDGMVGIVKDDESDTFDDNDAAHDHVAVSATGARDADYRRLCAEALTVEASSVAVRDLCADAEDPWEPATTGEAA